MSATNPTPSSGGYTVGLSTARFLDASLLDESSPVPVNPVPVPQSKASGAVPPATPAAIAPPATHPAADNDSSVADYMSQLMQRVKGGSSQPSAKSAVSNQNTTPPKENVEPALPNLNDVPLTSEEYVPKKQAPERKADMSSLRKLANDSTRVAITSFAERQYQTRRKINFAGIASPLLSAVPMFVMSQGFGDLWSLCGVAAAGASGFFGYRLYQLQRNWKKNQPNNPPAE